MSTDKRFKVTAPDGTIIRPGCPGIEKPRDACLYVYICHGLEPGVYECEGERWDIYWNNIDKDYLVVRETPCIVMAEKDIVPGEWYNLRHCLPPAGKKVLVVDPEGLDGFGKSSFSVRGLDQEWAPLGRDGKPKLWTVVPD